MVKELPDNGDVGVRHQQGEEKDGTIQIANEGGHAPIKGERRQQADAGIEEHGKDRKDEGVAVDGSDALVFKNFNVIVEPGVFRTAQDAEVHRADGYGLDD